MKRARRLLAILTGAFVLSWHARAADIVAEAEIKAAVIYNLLAFVDWPQESRAGDMRLCLFEGSALAFALDRMAGKSVHGQRLSPQRIGNAPDELRACLAVMIESGNLAALSRAAAAAKNQPLLVLGEGPFALDRGAMIGISVDGARVVFDIDVAALRGARLAVSSKLLRLARKLVE